MKQKFIYLLILIFCISTFSSARQNGKIGNACCCKAAGAKEAVEVKAGEVDADIFSLSPLMFSI